MLTQEQELIGQLIQDMPTELVRKVLDFTMFLKERRQQPAKPIDYSTEWTEEDLRDLTRSSMAAYLARHPDDDWGSLPM